MVIVGAGRRVPRFLFRFFRFVRGLDDCERCDGTRGVRGNENVVAGRTLCDDCTCEADITHEEFMAAADARGVRLRARRAVRG